MVDTLKAGPVPLESDTNVASVLLQDIFFAADLALPLYPTLFDYGAIPAGFNLVPSFQVRDSSITKVVIRLDLRENESFVFQQDPQDQQEVLFNQVNGQATVQSTFLSSKSCLLEIDLDPQPSLVVLQVLCERTSHESSPREQIEGGLFLAIVNDTAQVVPPTAAQMVAPSLAGSIQITKVDAQGRLHYNIFQDTVYIEDSPIVSAGLDPEPAFRVRQGEHLDSRISLALTNVVFVPRAEHPLEIALEMVEPATRPSHLQAGFPRTAAGEPVPMGCEIHWASPVDTTRQQYQVTSFSMEIHELTSEAQDFLKKELNWDGRFGLELLMLIATLIEDAEFQRKFPRIGTADPTIIDAPICTTINGQHVCSD